MPWRTPGLRWRHMAATHWTTVPGQWITWHLQLSFWWVGNSAASYQQGIANWSWWQLTHLTLFPDIKSTRPSRSHTTMVFYPALQRGQLAATQGHHPYQQTMVLHNAYGRQTQLSSQVSLPKAIHNTGTSTQDDRLPEKAPEAVPPGDTKHAPPPPPPPLLGLYHQF